MEVRCPKCSEEFEAAVAEERVECPACGEPFQASLAKVRRGWIGSVSFWVLLGVVIGGSGLVALLKLSEAGVARLEQVLDDGLVQRVKADLQTLEVALKIYQINAGSFPSTEQGLDALVTKPTTGKIPRRWKAALEEPILDPWGNLYEYRFPGEKNVTKPDIFSRGADGEAGTADDIGNW